MHDAERSPDGPVLTADMKAVIEAQRLCFAATVSPEGRPNLSPKGTIRVVDDHTLSFLDIASPETVRNLRHNPWIEINVIDQISRRGYRFLGTATIHSSGDIYDSAVSRIATEEGVAYRADTVVVVDVRQAKLVWSPGYDHVPDELAMRESWRKRRAELDGKFDEHLRHNGAFRLPTA
jgi:predicted pyridoxine 5'-phosphate oxidase superfamily flavin-nucleotide-binding protein